MTETQAANVRIEVHRQYLLRPPVLLHWCRVCKIYQPIEAMTAHDPKLCRDCAAKGTPCQSQTGSALS